MHPPGSLVWGMFPDPQLRPCLARWPGGVPQGPLMARVAQLPAGPARDDPSHSCWQEKRVAGMWHRVWCLGGRNPGAAESIERPGGVGNRIGRGTGGTSPGAGGALIRRWSRAGNAGRGARAEGGSPSCPWALGRPPTRSSEVCARGWDTLGTATLPAPARCRASSLCVCRRVRPPTPAGRALPTTPVLQKRKQSHGWETGGPGVPSWLITLSRWDSKETRKVAWV